MLSTILVQVAFLMFFYRQRDFQLACICAFKCNVPRHEMSETTNYTAQPDKIFAYNGSPRKKPTIARVV